MRCKAIFTLLILLFPSVLMAQLRPSAVGEIKPMIQFQIPTTDGQVANAVYMLTSDQKELLILANRQGDLIVYWLSKEPSPLPPNPPVPPTPTPAKLTIAIVEDPCCTPLKQKAVLADKGWRDRANASHNFIGVIPSTLIQIDTGKPPVFFQPYIDRAKGKTKPWLMFFAPNGTLLYEGAVPSTTAEMNSLLDTYGGK